MGTSSNKSTRKYSKRHLKKELSKRKKIQIIAKQKTEQQEKLKRSAQEKQIREKEVEKQRATERRLQNERETFLMTEEPETDEELMEIDSDVSSEMGNTTKNGIEADNDREMGLSSGDETAEDDEEVDRQIARYKAQLADLKSQDPEFYHYLQEADEQLLQFDVDEIPNMKTAPQDNNTECVARLTEEQVEKWCQEVSSEAPSLDSLKRLITAYAIACRCGESTEEEDGESIRRLPQFSNSAVYSRILLFVLKEGVGIFQKYLRIGTKNKSQREHILTEVKKHEDVAEQIKRFFLGTFKLLQQPALEDNILAFALRHIRASVIFMDGVPVKISKMFLRTAFEIFSSSTHAPRLQAVLLMREMILTLGPNTVHLCLKGVYKTFVSACAEVNWRTVPQIYFMGTCIIELYSLAGENAYQHAFAFIKELAIDLREAIVANDKEGWKKVYSWRFVNCLELWSRLVAALSENGQMQPLIYPVAQLLTGTARVQDQMRYIPMRLRLIASLHQLAEATGLFIPVSSLLLGLLSWSNLHKKPLTSGIDKCPDIALCLSVNEKTAKSTVFQSEVVEQALELLAKHLALFSHSIAFPETSHWIAVQLRRFAKGANMPSYKSGAMQLVTAIKECSANILKRRMQVSFSPRDIQKVQQFEVDGKATGKSPLEVLSHRLEEKRKQRASLLSTEVVTVGESSPEPVKEKKPRKNIPVSLSDAESLTSDEGELKEEELQGMPKLEFPIGDDVLQDYVLSEDDGSDQRRVKDKKKIGKKRSKEKPSTALTKQQMRKEKRALNRKKPPKKEQGTQ